MCEHRYYILPDVLNLKRLSPVLSPNNPSTECFSMEGYQGVKSLR